MSCCKHSPWYVVGVVSSVYFARNFIFKWGLFFCLLKPGRMQSRWFSTKTRNTGTRLMKVKNRSVSESYSEPIWLVFIKHLQYYFVAKQNTSNHSIDSFHKAALELIFFAICLSAMDHLPEVCVCVSACLCVLLQGINEACTICLNFMLSDWCLFQEWQSLKMIQKRDSPVNTAWWQLEGFRYVKGLLQLR